MFHQSSRALLLAAGLLTAVACQREAKMTSPASHAAFQAREGYIEAAEGIRLFYQLDGSGPEVAVFVQGGPGVDLRDVAPDFEGLTRGRTVIHYDHRGGGRSTLPQDTSLLHIDRLVEDLEAVRKHFGLERMNVVASSFGPIVAGLYASKYPERVHRLVLIASVGPRRTPYAMQYGRELFSRLGEAGRARFVQIFQSMDKAEDPIALCREYWSLAGPLQVANPESLSRQRSGICSGTAESVRYGITRTSPKVMASLGDWDLRPELGRVRAPTLVIHGEQDIFPLEGAREWAASIPGAKLLVVPEAGHSPH
ncbi:MAG TPA: alpha/beta hydrolase, partial [Myxococcaceae bacterium]